MTVDEIRERILELEATLQGELSRQSLEDERARHD